MRRDEPPDQVFRPTTHRVGLADPGVPRAGGVPPLLSAASPQLQPASARGVRGEVLPSRGLHDEAGRSREQAARSASPERRPEPSSSRLLFGEGSPAAAIPQRPWLRDREWARANDALGLLSPRPCFGEGSPSRRDASSPTRWERPISPPRGGLDHAAYAGHTSAADEALRLKMEVMARENEQLRNDVYRLRARTETAEVERRRFDVEKDNISANFQVNLSAERWKLAKEKEDLCAKLKGEETRAQSLQTERYRLQDENEDLSANLRAERLQVDSMRATLEELKAGNRGEVQRLLTEVEGTALELREERSRADGLAASLQNLQEQSRSERAQMESLHLRLDELQAASQAEIQRLHVKLENSAIELRDERSKTEQLAATLQAERARRSADVERLSTELTVERSTVETLEAHLRSERQLRQAEIEGRALDLKAARERADKEQAALASSLREDYARRIGEERESLERKRADAVAMLQDDAQKQAAHHDRRHEQTVQEFAAEMENRQAKQRTEHTSNMESFQRQVAAQRKAEVYDLQVAHDEAVCVLCRTLEHVGLHLSDRLLQFVAEVLRAELHKAGDCGVQGRERISTLRAYLVDTLTRRKSDFPAGRLFGACRTERSVSPRASSARGRRRGT